MGDATTLVNIVQRLGGAIGAAGLVIVVTQAGGVTDRGAYAAAFTVVTVIGALTILPGAALWELHRGRHVPIPARASSKVSSPSSSPTGTTLRDDLGQNPASGHD